MVTSFYASLALSLEDARHRPVLPVSRRSTSAAAFGGDFAEQLAELRLEAGVCQESWRCHAATAIGSGR